MQYSNIKRLSLRKPNPTFTNLMPFTEQMHHYSNYIHFENALSSNVANELSEEDLKAWWNPNDYTSLVLPNYNYIIRQPVFIDAPTSSGKTTFIIKSVLPFALKNDLNVLILSNRIALRQQTKRSILEELLDLYKNNQTIKNHVNESVFQKDLLLYTACKNSPEILDSVDNFFNKITISSYQKIFNVLSQHKYDIIIMDECHYFLSDSNFNKYTSAAYDKILHSSVENAPYYPVYLPEKVLMRCNPSFFLTIADIQNYFAAYSDKTNLLNNYSPEDQHSLLTHQNHLLDFISKQSLHIYLSATMDEFFPYALQGEYCLNERYNQNLPYLNYNTGALPINYPINKAKYIFFNRKNTYNHIDAFYLEHSNTLDFPTQIQSLLPKNTDSRFSDWKKELLATLSPIIKTILFEINDNVTDKWVIFINSKHLGGILENLLGKEHATFISSENKSNSTEYNEIIKKENFKSKVLITTSTLDNGVNIKDSCVKNVVITALDKTSFIQMLGRVRPQSNTRIRLYILQYSYSYIESLFSRNIDTLKKLHDPSAMTASLNAALDNSNPMTANGRLAKNYSTITASSIVNSFAIEKLFHESLFYFNLLFNIASQDILRTIANTNYKPDDFFIEVLSKGNHLNNETYFRGIVDALLKYIELIKAKFNTSCIYPIDAGTLSNDEIAHLKKLDRLIQQWKHLKKLHINELTLSVQDSNYFQNMAYARTHFRDTFSPSSSTSSTEISDSIITSIADPSYWSKGSDLSVLEQLNWIGHADSVSPYATIYNDLEESARSAKLELLSFLDKCSTHTTSTIKNTTYKLPCFVAGDPSQQLENVSILKEHLENPPSIEPADNEFTFETLSCFVSKLTDYLKKARIYEDAKPLTIKEIMQLLQVRNLPYKLTDSRSQLNNNRLTFYHVEKVEVTDVSSVAESLEKA